MFSPCREAHRTTGAAVGQTPTGGERWHMAGERDASCVEFRAPNFDKVRIQGRASTGPTRLDRKGPKARRETPPFTRQDAPSSRPRPAQRTRSFVIVLIMSCRKIEAWKKRVREVTSAAACLCEGGFHHLPCAKPRRPSSAACTSPRTEFPPPGDG